MKPDRLSVLDESFLRLESDVTPMHVGWTLLAEGQPPALEELRAHVSARLEALPRFRRRVVTSPMRLHAPVWVDDQAFDIANHVAAGAAPAPGGDAELRRLAGALLSIPLDRDRPLWRLHLIDGLAGSRFAVVGLAHHALVDGIAAVEVAGLLLDAEGVRRMPAPRRWAAARAPTVIDRTLSSLEERVRLLGAGGSVALRALMNPGAIRDGVRMVAEMLSALGRPAEPTSLNRRVGPDRTVAFADLPLQPAKELGRAHGGTVNDVVLATTALATGSHLRRRRECRRWLRALVPVSTRPTGQAVELGNRVSVMFVELPIGERDPGAAFDAVCRQTRQLKRSGSADGIDAMLRAAGVMPAMIRDAAAWAMTRPQTWSMVVSNIPGPQTPLYLLGRPVRAAYPAVPLAHGHGLSVGVLSYSGRLHVGLYADPDVVPDLASFGDEFARSFDALRFALGARAPEGGPREPALT